MSVLRRMLLPRYHKENSINVFGSTGGKSASLSMEGLMKRDRFSLGRTGLLVRFFCYSKKKPTYDKIGNVRKNTNIAKGRGGNPFPCCFQNRSWLNWSSNKKKVVRVYHFYLIFSLALVWFHTSAVQWLDFCLACRVPAACLQRSQGVKVEL